MLLFLLDNLFLVAFFKHFLCIFIRIILLLALTLPFVIVCNISLCYVSLFCSLFSYGFSRCLGIFSLFNGILENWILRDIERILLPFSLIWMKFFWIDQKSVNRLQLTERKIEALHAIQQNFDLFQLLSHSIFDHLLSFSSFIIICLKLGFFYFAKRTIAYRRTK